MITEDEKQAWLDYEELKQETEQKFRMMVLDRLFTIQRQLMFLEFAVFLFFMLFVFGLFFLGV